MGAVKKVVEPVIGPATVGMGIFNGIKGQMDAKADQRRAKEVANEARKGLDDLSMRREATYRAKRAELQGAIESFYKEKGWPLPDKTLPGYGTTRALPGEKPLYEGVSDAPKGETQSGLQLAEDDGEDTSDVVDQVSRHYGGGVVSPAPMPNQELQPGYNPVQIVDMPYDDINKRGGRYGL
jgi:hypothetical protein